MLGQKNAGVDIIGIEVLRGWPWMGNSHVVGPEDFIAGKYTGYHEVVCNGAGTQGWSKFSGKMILGGAVEVD